MSDAKKTPTKYVVATAHNLGVMDAALRRVTWTLENMRVNSGMLTDSQVRAIAGEGIAEIRRAYAMLQTTGDYSGGNAILAGTDVLTPGQ